MTKYYKALGRLVAFRRDGVLHWVGTDHLGSTVRVTDSVFAALDGQRYRAYGEQRDPGSRLNMDKRFTGQTEDALIGPYWYASRAHDSSAFSIRRRASTIASDILVGCAQTSSKSAARAAPGSQRPS